MTADPHFIGFGLHDAIFEKIIVDWPTGIVTVSLPAVVPRAERVVITATGMLDLICTRRQPWGRGDHIVYVNDVRLSGGDEYTERRLEIEMGSGDMLTIIAAAFERVANTRE